MSQNKVVIITGATGGIGNAVAHEFARNGGKLLLADINDQSLQLLADRLNNEYGAECVPAPGDLSDTTYLKTLVQTASDRWGRIDVLINNAAWRVIQTMRTTELEDWNRTISVCLTAPAFLSKWAAALMEERNTHGVIINISSIMSERPAGYCPAYIAAKGALDSLTKELAITYGRKNIRVIGVSPGVIDTDLSADYENDDHENISEKIKTNILDFIPVPRMGSPREIASLIGWLTDDNAAYITGTNIIIDGGFSSNFSNYSLKSLQFPKEF